ncbi:DUF3298 domain-containing protein [Trinickia dinghuensis]|uniref:DUF3298 domain-containing protein n=2 Tax=Trinickia dinghuensis TaxID=2291023 RepID=A0A3D8JTJ2_9BURK|nr:DUF3298 domain-containing protein [Trinickia dinghuensis]
MQTILSRVRGRSSLVCGVLFACLMPTVAAAASFDCGKARTALEKTVCADPRLSAQDAEMARRYDHARSMLSEQGKAILFSGQKQWLKVIPVLCLEHKREESPTQCLRGQYKDRLDSLQTAAIRIGPFLFSRIDTYASPGIDAATGTPLEQHIGLPRIDSPPSKEAEQWNTTIVRLSNVARAHWCFGEFEAADPKDPETRSEQNLTFDLYAHNDFINVKFTHYERCGAAAANEEVDNVSYFLESAARPLTAADLFAPNSHWDSSLVNRAEQKLDAPNPSAEKDFRAGIAKVVNDPTAWSFTERGLVLSFNAGFGGASIASGPIDVTIPWKDLYSFVTPTAPIPQH